MSDPRVRLAVPADVSTLVAFNLAMARETEGKSLDPAVVERGVRGVFERPARGSYFVLEEERVLGCLLLTTEWSDWRDGELWWIQSVYVEPAARGRGVYSALHRHVLAEARRTGAVGVRLYVEPSNARAVATYQHLGMRKTYDVMEAALEPE